jgi:hypothetical protein
LRKFGLCASFAGVLVAFRTQLYLLKIEAPMWT